MAIKFLSEQWRLEVQKKLNEEVAAEKLTNLDLSLNSQFNNCPDGKTRYLHMGFAGGTVESVQVVEDNPPEAEFTISGDYDSFADLFSYKLKLQDALTGGKFKFEGSMIKALEVVPKIQGIIEALSGVETKF